MFEDTLIESAGRMRTRRTPLTLLSLLLQAAIVLALTLSPLLVPQALPRQSLIQLRLGPPPPAAPPHTQPAQPARANPRATALQTSLTAPSRIPARILTRAEEPPPQFGSGSLPGTGVQEGVIGSVLDAAGPPAPHVVSAPTPRARGPVRVSSGVAQGQLVAPIHATYPAIAKAAGVQGTVVVAATISPQGTIEGIHVVSGAPMLQGAAVEAVRAARYRPFLLNGAPVAVETTINIVFSLGG